MHTPRRKTWAISLVALSALLIIPAWMFGLWVGLLLVFIPLLVAIVLMLRPTGS